MHDSGTGPRTQADRLSAIARHIWDTKYRWREAGAVRDARVEDTWRRVADALAGAEADDRAGWARRFRDALADFKFLPGGRILAGAGTAHRVTLFNCFVMGLIEDSMDGIFDALKEGALTMQQGGGVGYDFSTLRPRGTLTRHTGTIASGPVSFMRIWDAMCGTLLSTGARRGAMMATLRCDHPDIEEFIDAKGAAGELTRFNLSVQVFDELMDAVAADADWALVFPDDALQAGPNVGIVHKRWPGRERPVPCRVVRRVRARDLWERIMRATYDHAEPGVLFVDRINTLNNLAYREHITATNPCGEVPLPPYGACDLGSINLTRFVRAPFEEDAAFDWEGLSAIVPVAVRMLDDVVDVSRFPLERQAETERGNRRVGLGLTGLADALIMLGLRYDSDQGRALAAQVMALVCHEAYRASIALAREKGPFPFFERDAYLAAPFVRALPDDIAAGIAEHGVRNSHLTAIAPTGTISLYADNVSSGLEPVYDFSHSRRVLELDGSYTEYAVRDYAYRRWLERRGESDPPDTLPAHFVTAYDLAPQAHLEMQAALQPYVDSSISKTINVPEDFPFESFKAVYETAYAKGLKGCTTFRPNPVTGRVLQADRGERAPHCCSPEREAD